MRYVGCDTCDICDALFRLSPYVCACASCARVRPECRNSVESVASVANGFRGTRILPAIRRIAARPNYAPPRLLSYFDRAIREGRAA